MSREEQTKKFLEAHDERIFNQGVKKERLRTKEIITEIICITKGCDSQCYATSKLEKLIEETEPKKEEIK